MLVTSCWICISSISPHLLVTSPAAFIMRLPVQSSSSLPCPDASFVQSSVSPQCRLVQSPSFSHVLRLHHHLFRICSHIFLRFPQFVPVVSTCFPCFHRFTTCFHHFPRLRVRPQCTLPDQRTCCRHHQGECARHRHCRCWAKECAT